MKLIIPLLGLTWLAVAKPSYGAVSPCSEQSQAQSIEIAKTLESIEMFPHEHGLLAAGIKMAQETVLTPQDQKCLNYWLEDFRLDATTILEGYRERSFERVKDQLVATYCFEKGRNDRTCLSKYNQYSDLLACWKQQLVNDIPLLIFNNDVDLGYSIPFMNSAGTTFSAISIPDILSNKDLNAKLSVNLATTIEHLCTQQELIPFEQNQLLGDYYSRVVLSLNHRISAITRLKQLIGIERYLLGAKIVSHYIEAAKLDWQNAIQRILSDQTLISDQVEWLIPTILMDKLAWSFDVTFGQDFKYTYGEIQPLVRLLTQFVGNKSHRLYLLLPPSSNSDGLDPNYSFSTIPRDAFAIIRSDVFARQRKERNFEHSLLVASVLQQNNAIADDAIETLLLNTLWKKPDRWGQNQYSAYLMTLIPMTQNLTVRALTEKRVAFEQVIRDGQGEQVKLSIFYADLLLKMPQVALDRERIKFIGQILFESYLQKVSQEQLILWDKLFLLMQRLAKTSLKDNQANFELMRDLFKVHHRFIHRTYVLNPTLPKLPQEAMSMLGEYGQILQWRRMINLQSSSSLSEDLPAPLKEVETKVLRAKPLLSVESDHKLASYLEAIVTAEKLRVILDWYGSQDKPQAQRYPFVRALKRLIVDALNLKTAITGGRQKTLSLEQIESESTFIDSHETNLFTQLGEIKDSDKSTFRAELTESSDALAVEGIYYAGYKMNMEIVASGLDLIVHPLAMIDSTGSDVAISSHSITGLFVDTSGLNPASTAINSKAGKAPTQISKPITATGSIVSGVVYSIVPGSDPKDQVKVKDGNSGGAIHFTAAKTSTGNIFISNGSNGADGADGINAPYIVNGKSPTLKLKRGREYKEKIRYASGKN